MAVMTPWGYSVDELPPLISSADYETHGLDALDVRAEAAVESASAAVRAWCGWHVAPVLRCEARVTADGGKVCALPALAVRSVESVTEDGSELDEGAAYEWLPNGLLRRCGFKAWTCRWGGIAAVYEAGLPTESAAIVSQVCAQLAANALGPAGVRREQAGGVSVEYNADADGQGGSMALTASMRQLLAPYRLPTGAS